MVYNVLGFGNDSDTEVAVQDQQTTDRAETEDETADTTADESTESVSASENILQTKGCLGCHSVNGLNLQGGATGPDLSKAITEVEGKHGKPLEEFLKEPTSAVMSGVIGGNPLTEEEISQVVDLLKQASESN
nr:cytochrome C [Bacillus sp. FJAT-47783]